MGLTILGLAASLVASAGAHTPAKFEFIGPENTFLHTKYDGNHEIDIPGYGTLV